MNGYVKFCDNQFFFSKPVYVIWYLTTHIGLYKLQSDNYLFQLVVWKNEQKHVIFIYELFDLQNKTFKNRVTAFLIFQCLI